MISGPIVPLLLLEKIAMFAYKRGMFCESKIEMVEREWERENREKERAAMAAALLPLQQLQQLCVRAGSRVEWM